MKSITASRFARLGCVAMALSLTLAGHELGAAPGDSLEGGNAQWIWSPEQPRDSVPAGVVYFRRMFQIREPESATIDIACDDAYELFVNGRRVGAGDSWQRLDTYDIQPFIQPGRNLIAVKAENRTPGSAGLVAVVAVKNRGNTHVSFSTDNKWRSSVSEARYWNQTSFKDADWPAAAMLGELGKAAPWAGEVQNDGGRFQIQPEFKVERVADPDHTGSVIAMTFNELGHIIASQERGPLVMLRDEDRDGQLETAHTYSDEVKNCQGILALNGHVFAVGDGPDKTGLYVLSDDNQDGKADQCKLLFKFTGGMGEHGPHAPVLGPDGLIYVMIGNHSQQEPDPESTSPYHHPYEGDLIQPRYEDAGGHGHGIKAPGGSVIRTDIEGSFVELYAGGFRNAYDMVFNEQGELFTYDSDMEWDVGEPWYRPTRINHIIAGSEFGWRSGWAPWPEYFLDNLPATIDIGRGSPTGMECYNHHMFPVRYHNCIFAGDWSMGRIIAIRMKRAGGTYTARSEVFLQGRPLNVTDLAVGPDGWLYFSTGGRGTEGGIYRVRWLGNVPPQPKLNGIMQAIRQPQLSSAWGRNRVANLRQQMGAEWDSQIVAVARDRARPSTDRTRALDLMQLVGPFPTTELLVGLSHDSDADVRTKCAFLMGVNSDASTSARLAELLDDADSTVRRTACESIVRSGNTAPTARLIELLSDPSRFTAWAARRALERAPRDQWQSVILSTEDPRTFVMGATALLVLEPDKMTAIAILQRSGDMLKRFVEDDDFVSLLRVMQLALIRGNLQGDDVADLRAQLDEEYPALSPRMNRELVRLLVYMQDDKMVGRLLEQIHSDETSMTDKLHAALYSRFLQKGWNTQQRLDMLAFYELSRTLPGGFSYKGYIDNVARDFVAQLTPEEVNIVWQHATQIPNATLMSLHRLPEQPSGETLARLIQMDRELGGVEGEAARRLQTGIVAVLGSSKDDQAMVYLREVFERDPSRREDLAMGMAQRPDGENWPFLLRALPICEGPAAEELLARLAESDQKADQPEMVRQVILAGLKLKERGAKHSVGILQKWTGESHSKPEDKWDVALAGWQEWFTQKYPELPPPKLPMPTDQSRWTYQELMDFLSSEQGQAGNPARGEFVFNKAQCAKCHRYGTRGEGLGPDLTTLSQRFQKKEILESILYPSQVISDQYVSRTVVTTDGLTHTGIIDPSQQDPVVIVDSTAQKHSIPADQVDQIVPSNKSVMPENLLNDLTLEEIADLFIFLSKPAPIR